VNEAEQQENGPSKKKQKQRDVTDSGEASNKVISAIGKDLFSLARQDYRVVAGNRLHDSL
jgi:hypothetical protein